MKRKVVLLKTYLSILFIACVFTSSLPANRFLGEALLIGADFAFKENEMVVAAASPRSKLGVVLGAAIDSALQAPINYPVGGKEVFGEVETAYQRGEYDSFLKALDEQYRRAGEAGALKGVFEVARAVVQNQAPQLEESQKQKIAQLDKDRNRRLLEAVETLPKSAIAQTVDHIVYYNIAPQFEEILSELANLKYILPKGERGVDDKISALETEYTIKSHLLDIANHRSGSSKEELQKKKIALGLEKLSRMKAAAREGRDGVWEEKIATAQLAYRIRNAFKWDLQRLTFLAQGEVAPKNSVEEKVQQIMIDYLQQIENLR